MRPAEQIKEKIHVPNIYNNFVVLHAQILDLFCELSFGNMLHTPDVYVSL